MEGTVSGVRTAKENAPKTATRIAMRSLLDSGVDVFYSSYGSKNIQHLAKDHPELLDTLVERIGAAWSREKTVWTHLIGNTIMFPTKQKHANVVDYSGHYLRWLELLPVCIDLYPDGSEGYSLSRSIDRLAKTAASYVSEDKAHHGDSYREVVALMIIMQVHRTRGKLASIAPYRKDAGYIASRLIDVAPVVPELMRRGTTDHKVISELVAASPALADGVL